MKHRMVGDANQESYLIDESDCCGHGSIVFTQLPLAGGARTLLG